MPEWDPEVEVDEALARRLICERHPDLDAGSLRMLGVGWDNTVWATRDGVAFRFPRRKIALDGIQRELSLLPQLAPHLPCAIPDAAYPGAPGPLFPWPWFGSRVIEGHEISEAPVLAHGDLHVRHALLDGAGRLSGVIDWGDICRAPAAIDLSLFWSVFGAAARERFLAAYGEADEAGLLRARVLALQLSAVLASYARLHGMPALEAETLGGLERALAG